VCCAPFSSINAMICSAPAYSRKKIIDTSQMRQLY
jgi:hypothetical protein